MVFGMSNALNEITKKTYKEANNIERAIVIAWTLGGPLAEAAAEELSTLQKRVENQKRMIIGLATMLNNPKGCQFKAVYDESGCLVDVVEIKTTTSIGYGIPVKLAE